MIHSDFERGFIKAEVCAYEDFKTLGNGTKSMVRTYMTHVNTSKYNEKHGIVILIYFFSVLQANVKAAGRYRQEGRNYVMQDGDIVHFMFNVSNSKK